MSRAPGGGGTRRRPGRIVPLRRSSFTVLAMLLSVILSGGCGSDGEVGEGGASTVTEEGRPGGAQPTLADREREEVARSIRQMLEASAGSWNAGDLEGFLDDYSTDPRLTFSGSDGVIRGREAVRERYLASYWAEGVERDSLRFEDVEVRVLGPDHALTLGRYVLFRPEADSVTAQGYFSLVLRKEEGEGWKIIHDHSS